MTDKDRIYKEKREFVRELNLQLKKAGQIPCIEYWHIWDKHSEYLSYKDDGEYRFINVTGDSLYAIAQEISRIVLKLNSAAEIKHDMHKALIEGWIESERAK